MIEFLIQFGVGMAGFAEGLGVHVAGRPFA